jgi:hypothetical protein
MVIDDDGYIFMTSVNYLLGLINGKAKHNFILLKRMPFKTTDTKFAPSPVWIPEGMAVDEKTLSKENATGDDALSTKFKKKQEQVKSFADKIVDFEDL